MFLSCLKNIDKDKSLLPASLHTGLNFIRNTDFSRLPDGEHTIDNDTRVIISAYMPEPASNRKAEAHKKYIDIQFLIEGEEFIGYADLQEAGELIEEKPENDLFFYQTVAHETFCAMRPGSYAVFYPWDIHRPNCRREKLQKVRKAVVKVAFKGESV